MNEHVSYLYTPFHPAVLRLIKGVIDSAHSKGIPVSVCGEMASQLPCVPLLVGMGVDELSMNTHSIPRVKKLLKHDNREGIEGDCRRMPPLENGARDKGTLVKDPLSRNGGIPSLRIS